MLTFSHNLTTPGNKMSINWSNETFYSIINKDFLTFSV